MSTRTWIPEKELARDIKKNNKQTEKTNFVKLKEQHENFIAAGRK